MKKQIQLFLSSTDEMHWSRALKTSIPGIRILNDNVWSGGPDERQGVEECASGRAYLFNGDLKALPTLVRRNGDVEGPIAGCVIQVLRPRAMGALLLSGRVAAGIDDSDEKMRSFADKVWRTVREIGKIGVLRPDGKIDKNYLVGNDLISQLKNEEVKIADGATQLLYRLPNR